MITAKRAIGDTAKFIRKDDGNRVGGYLVRFTDAEDTDLHDEYFSRETDFWIERGYPIKGERVLLEHGLDDFAKVMPIGILDMVKEDEIGIYVEARLHDRQEYEDMLREMQERGKLKASNEEIIQKAELAAKAIQAIADTGKIQWSSGALPQSVEVEDKHIKSWAIMEGSLTFTPAEPEGTEIRTIKTAIEQLQDLLQTAKTQTTKEPSGAKEASVSSADVNIQRQTQDTQGQVKMDEQAIRDIIRMVIEEQAKMENEEDMPPEEEIEKAIEPDVAKMEDEEEMDDEQKSIRVAQLAADYVVKKLEAEQRKKEAVRKAAKARFGAYNASLPVDDDARLPNAKHDSKPRKHNPITVEEMRAYAGVDAAEMALTIKLAMAKVPAYARKGMKLSDLVERGIVSDEFIRTMAHKGATKLDSWTPRDDALEQNDYATMKTFRFLKADELAATDITNQGAEWVELLYDTQAWRRVREETELFNQLSNKGMRIRNLPTGVKGMNVKLVDGSGTVYTHSEGGSVDATGRPSVTATPTMLTTNEVEKNLATHIIAEGFTFQLAERSMLNIAQELNEDIVTTLAESLEDAIINGDTRTAASTNINLIDGTPGTGLQKPLYLAWNGLRYEPLITNTDYASDHANAALAATDYETVRALWPLRVRRRKQNILFVIDEGVETKTRQLAEHFTVGVAGERATFFSGDLNVLVGYDVYASSFLRKSNGAGKVSATAGNNTQGQILGVFAPYCQYGRQLAINIEEDRFAMSQASVFVATVNHLFAVRSEHAAVLKYDIAV